MSPADTSSPGKEKPDRSPYYWPGAVLSIVLAAILLATICSTAYFVLHHPPADRFTELYLLGSGGKADCYPAELVVGQNATVIARVEDHEHTGATYDLSVVYKNGTASETAFTNHIVLQDGGTWEEPYAIAPDIPGNRVMIEFLLYRDGDLSSPYRECHLWMNISLPYNYGQRRSPDTYLYGSRSPDTYLYGIPIS